MNTFQDDQILAKLPEHYAVVYAPRRTRPRFPANTVTLVASAEEAVSQSDPEKKLYAAKICGPMRSSESHEMFYLIHWIE